MLRLCKFFKNYKCVKKMLKVYMWPIPLKKRSYSSELDTVIEAAKSKLLENFSTA